MAMTKMRCVDAMLLGRLTVILHIWPHMYASPLSSKFGSCTCPAAPLASGMQSAVRLASSMGMTSPGRNAILIFHCNTNGEAARVCLPSWNSSNTTEKAPSMGAQLTSSIGRTVSPSVASKKVAPLAFSLHHPHMAALPILPPAISSNAPHGATLGQTGPHGAIRAALNCHWAVISCRAVMRPSATGHKRQCCLTSPVKELSMTGGAAAF